MTSRSHGPDDGASMGEEGQGDSVGFQPSSRPSTAIIEAEGSGQERLLSKAQRAKNLTASLRLAQDAVDRCRQLLIYADAEAEDLAEYDAAAEGLRMTLADWFYEMPAARLSTIPQPLTSAPDTDVMKGRG